MNKNSVNTGFAVSPGGILSGTIEVPGDKSISHRAVMLGSIANGKTDITGLLEGEDVLATIAAMRAMGVSIEGPEAGCLTIKGVGLNGLKAPESVLDMGNSGTAMRLLTGLLAGQAFESELSGDDSLKCRPMERVAEPLRKMGAEIGTSDGLPPLHINGVASVLGGVTHHLKIASAQLKSALLLAGLYARGVTKVYEPAPTRDHTERMLKGFGCKVDRGEGWVSLEGGQSLTASSVDVPGDISSAAFFLAAAAFSPGSSITVQRVGINPTRTGVLKILEAMGATVRLGNKHMIAGEPVADIGVTGAKLSGIDIPDEWVPLAIDEFPVLCIAAATARGTTRVRGAAELRVKESDRIHAVAEGLAQLGIEVVQYDDGLDIVGGRINGGKIQSHSDHRISMAFAMAGLASKDFIEISDCKNVATSFPGFVALASNAGLRIREA